MNYTNEFIHYGSSKFLDDYWCNPVTSEYGSKPMCGGLWASPTDAVFSWKDFCERDDFFTEDLKESFRFKLKDNARVLVMRNIKDLEKIPTTDGEPFHFLKNALDFEKLSKDYDAVIAYLFEDGWDAHLRYVLTSWDVDSILVLNKDIVEVIE